MFWDVLKVSVLLFRPKLEALSWDTPPDHQPVGPALSPPPPTHPRPCPPGNTLTPIRAQISLRRSVPDRTCFNVMSLRVLEAVWRHSWTQRLFIDPDCMGKWWGHYDSGFGWLWILDHKTYTLNLKFLNPNLKFCILSCNPTPHTIQCIQTPSLK